MATVTAISTGDGPTLTAPVAALQRQRDLLARSRAAYPGHLRPAGRRPGRSPYRRDHQPRARRVLYSMVGPTRRCARRTGIARPPGRLWTWAARQGWVAHNVAVIERRTHRRTARQEQRAPLRLRPARRSVGRHSPAAA
jgi:hypothetical protein